MNQILKLLTLLLAVTLLTGCNKTEELDFSQDITEFFNKRFAIYLEERGYIPDAKKIIWVDVKDIKRLDVIDIRILENGQPGSYYLNFLAGIEYFTSLDTLYCHNNQLLEKLNVSKNTTLTVLDCSYNRLTSLNISNNTALKMLHCYSNQLTSLDVSKSAKLATLNCSGNQLTALDVNKNTVLTELHCSNNQLTALDIRKNTALTTLTCDINFLTTLNITQNTALTSFSCRFNPGQGTGFPVVAWFDNSNIPPGFTIGGWYYYISNSPLIEIDYIKSENRSSYETNF